MPVPTSDAIASDVGHGALGIRYELRPFRDLLSETVGQRHLWVEFRPKKVLASWNFYGSDTYWKAVSETFDGVVLDIVGVQTLAETLARVESLTLCTATAGRFYYNDITGILYIHLTAGANPSGTTVVAELGIHVGSHGVYQPILGADRLTNGTLDAWTGSAPDGWTSAVGSGGGVTLDKTTADPLQGSYAARFTFTAASGPLDYGHLYQDFTTLAVGSLYRVSGAYRNTCAVEGLRVLLNVWDGTSAYLLSDGRTIGSDPVFSDTAGQGEWKRFSFDFMCPSWATVRIHLKADVPSGTQTGTVDFDDLNLQPVSRFAFHEPLLSIDSLPTIESARADSFWGQMSSSLGSFSLLNGGGYWETLLATYDWLGAQAIIQVGGRYQLGANEILMDDCPVIAIGKLGAPTITDSGITFELEDDHSILAQTLPTRTYNNNGTDAYTQPDRGRSRPLLFGMKLGIRPVQYDIHYTGGGPVPLGEYEIVDMFGWPAGMENPEAVHWYADDQAATARSAVRRITAITWGSSLSAIVPHRFDGRFTVLRDLRPVEITQENNKLYFNVGGGTLVATIATGTYPLVDVAVDGLTATGLLATIQAAMRALDGADIICDFTLSTQKVRIAKGAGTLSLLCATGSDVQNGIWEILGFDASIDKIGLLTYNSDNVFTSQAFDQTLRLDVTGYVDDTGGPYTGTATDPIEKAPDIAHFILREILKVPASAIDLPSFVAARAVATRPCSLYIAAPRTVADVFNELETSGNFDLVLKGGVWHCITRDDSVPAGTPDLVDADYLSFEEGYNPEDLYGTVTLTYNEAPDGGDPINPGTTWISYAPHSRTEMGEVTDATVVLRNGRPHQKTFKTCLRDKDHAAYPLAGSRLEEIATLCSTKRRRFRFATKGKALQIPVNGKIRLTRTRGLDTTGALSNVLVRVISKRDDWARWVSEIEAIEVL